MHSEDLRRPSPILRVASLEQALRIGVDNAMALAASAGFERIELPAAVLPSSVANLRDLGGLSNELGLVVAAVGLPWGDLESGDLLELCRRCEALGCHRLVAAVDGEHACGAAGRALDAIGYRLAGRSATLTVRVEGCAPDDRSELLGRLLRELSQSAVALELEAIDHELFARWWQRARAIGVPDRLLLDPPAGAWRQPLSPGPTVLDWLRKRPRGDLVIRHEAGSLDEGDALTRARSRWRSEIENRERSGSPKRARRAAERASVGGPPGTRPIHPPRADRPGL